MRAMAWVTSRTLKACKQGVIEEMKIKISVVRTIEM